MLGEIKVVLSHDCPPDTCYLIDASAASSIAQHPKVAVAIAEGHDPILLAPNRQVAAEVDEAVKKAVKITGLA